MDQPHGVEPRTGPSPDTTGLSRAVPPAEDVADDRDIYAAAVTVPLHRLPLAANIGMPLVGVGGALTFLLVEGRSVSTALIAAAWLGLWYTFFVAVRLPTRTVGVALGHRSVTLSSNDDVRRIPLSVIDSVEISPLPYGGENLAPAVANFLIRGMYTLTIVDTHGNRFHCAIDIGTEYGERIAEALSKRKRPITPWEAYQAEQRESSKETRQEDGWSKAEVIEEMRRQFQAAGGNAASERFARTEPPASHETLWAESGKEHDRVLLEYGAYETDPLLLLRYPSIVDVTVDETADFFHALGEAGALRTDSFPGAGETFEAYRLAVRTLVRAWARSEKRAKSVGVSELSDPDQRRISQAAKLLRHAESAASQLERGAYLHQARAILDKLVEAGAITPPPKMLFEIQASASQALERGRSEA